MTKDSDTKSGRITLDERGQATWEWRSANGSFTRDIDTLQVKKLQEQAEAAFQSEPLPATSGVDPYSTATVSPPGKQPRRTLDDMRKLSEEIKRQKQRK